MGKLLTVNGLAEACGVDRRTAAKRLKKAGIKPTERRGEFSYYDYEQAYACVKGDDGNSENFLLLVAHTQMTLAAGEVFDHVGRCLADKLRAAGLTDDQAGEIIAAAAVAQVDAWREQARTGAHMNHVAFDIDGLARAVLKPGLAPKGPCLRYKFPRLFHMPRWVTLEMEKAGLQRGYIMCLGEDAEE